MYKLKEALSSPTLTLGLTRKYQTSLKNLPLTKHSSLFTPHQACIMITNSRKELSSPTLTLGLTSKYQTSLKKLPVTKHPILFTPTMLVLITNLRKHFPDPLLLFALPVNIRLA
jgi:hypothetical protein